MPPPKHLFEIGLSLSKPAVCDWAVALKQKCHPDRSEAKWRDLLFILRIIESDWKPYPPLCHPDRSVPGFPATLHWTSPSVRLSVRERRMSCINAITFHRKSGGAKWRDLQFRGPFLEMCFDTRAVAALSYENS
jgi:hypothetical protein